MSQGVRIPDGFVDELKARVRPSDIIGRKVKLTKKGKEWVGLSPFTNEKSPSFYVNDQKRIFKCFSSGMGGDVISFIMETERLSFMEAVEKLADEAGMQLPKASPEAAEEYDHRKRLQGACEAAATYFEECLRGPEGAAARAYLDGRGFSEAAWKRHCLGFAPDDWRKTSEYLRSKGFSKKELLEAGLTKESDKGGEPYDAFRGRLMFPIADSRGGIIAFGGRGLTPDAKPKYLNSGDTPLFHKSKVLYRYKAAREALGHGEGGGLLVCEGYMDAIALTEAGFGTAVAPLGTALTEEQISLLWRAGPEPVLCFDGDAAGIRAAHKAIDRALPYVEPGRSLYFVLLPDGMDPDDLIRANGPAAMGEALDGRISLSELLWIRERDAESVDTPERQAGLEARLMAAAGQIQHSAVRNAYERDLRARMKDHFWQQKKKARKDAPARPKSGQWPKKTGPLPFPTLNMKPYDDSPAATAQAMKDAVGKKNIAKIRATGALARCVDNPHLIELGTEVLASCVFPDPDVALLRDAILDAANAGKPIDRKALSTHLLEIGNMRAASLLNEYPVTPQIVANGPEAREWLIVLEQYVAVGSSGEQDPDSGMDAASEGATASPSAWRRKRQLVAEREALMARMIEAAGKVGES